MQQEKILLTLLPQNSPVFPPAESALCEPNGLLAAGGNLAPKTLLKAYQQGIFPWYNEDEPILWWSPEPRMVLFPDKIHLGKSTKKALRSMPFSLTLNHSFAEVVQACANSRPDTWLHSEMQKAYLNLHQLGHAYSVEAWENGELVGGVYGVRLYKAFFAESMFRYKNNSSKLAFIHLIAWLRASGCTLIDCQVSSPHVERLGAQLITRRDFKKLLNIACPKIPDTQPILVQTLSYSDLA